MSQQYKSGRGQACELDRTAPAHGGDVDRLAQKLGVAPAEILDFSANVSPFGVPDSVRAAVVAALETAARYPDPRSGSLRQAIANWHQLPSGQVHPGNGGTELIFRFALSLRRWTDRRKVLIPVPTFLEYEAACLAAGFEVLHYPLYRSGSLQAADDVLDSIDSELAAVMVCNPNNPTGLLWDPQLLQALQQKCRQTGTLLFVDECFQDLLQPDRAAGHSLISKLQLFPEMVILRSLTKLYAIPGIRLGYMLTAQQQFWAQLEHLTPPWSIGCLGQAAGIAALRDDDYRQTVWNWLAQAQPAAKAQLATLPVSQISGEANYLFFRVLGCTDLQSRLLHNHRPPVLIRSCANYPGLPADTYRIAILESEKMAVLFARLAAELC